MQTQSHETLKAVLVGESWGRHEDMFQHPLVGGSGVELAEELHEAGLAPALGVKFPSQIEMISFWQHLRQNYGIGVTNVFQERPPDNEVAHFFDVESRNTSLLPRYKPSQTLPNCYLRPDKQHHVEKLYTELKQLQPNITILLGNIACWALLKQTKITALRGVVQASEVLGIKCIPTYHPAFILRQWKSRPVAIADFIKAKRESDFPHIIRPKRFFTFQDDYSPYYLQEIEDWINTKPYPAITNCNGEEVYPNGLLSCDIESGYALYTSAELKNMTARMRYILSSQISMIGFAKSLEDAMVIPFMSRNGENLSFWPSIAEESKAWFLARQLLHSPIPKMFQNGLYDMNRLMYVGIRVRNAVEDTMLKHHSLYPELPKSLGFLGSLYSNEQAWKTMYAQGESLKRDD